MSLVVFAAVLAVLALAEVVLFFYVAYLLLEWGVEAARERWRCRSRWGRTTPASLSFDLRRLSALANVDRAGLQPPRSGATRAADDPHHPQRLGRPYRKEKPVARLSGVPARMDVTRFKVPCSAEAERGLAEVEEGAAEGCDPGAAGTAPQRGRSHRVGPPIRGRSRRRGRPSDRGGPRTGPPVPTHPAGQGVNA